MEESFRMSRLTRAIPKWARLPASGSLSGTSRPGERSSATSMPSEYLPIFPVSRAPNCGWTMRRGEKRVVGGLEELEVSRKKGRFSGKKNWKGGVRGTWGGSDSPWVKEGAGGGDRNGLGCIESV